MEKKKKMKKIYKVNFIMYTNFTKTTVCENDDVDTYKVNYLDAPKNLFLACEDDLDELRKYGNGIDTIEFVGYLYES